MKKKPINKEKKDKPGSYFNGRFTRSLHIEDNYIGKTKPEKIEEKEERISLSNF